MQTPSRIIAPKSYQRSQRAETRNRLKDELKRLSTAVDKVRKWEKRWVVLKDSSISVYKWVPVSGSSLKTTPKAASVTVNGGEDTNASMASAENSNDATNITSAMDTKENLSAGHEEDSNIGFSEGFDSDSNQTQTFDRIDYRPSGGDALTDFSTMVQEEVARENQDPNA